jgi:hypothetical protein
MMNFLFEKSHPKDLVEALKKIHDLDESKGIVLSYYDNTIVESQLIKPVFFLFDYKKKGLDVPTENMFHEGYGIIALKTDLEEKLNFFDLSITLFGLWPKILKAATENSHPFVFTYRYKGNKLNKYKMS